MREAIENPDFTANFLVEIRGVDRKPFRQPLPNSESGVNSLAALKRLFEHRVSTARLNPNERSHCAEAEAITQCRARSNRYAIKVVVVRESARIEICRDGEAQMIGQLAEATKCCVPVEGEVALLVGRPVRVRKIVVVGNFAEKISDPIAARAMHHREEEKKDQARSPKGNTHGPHTESFYMVGRMRPSQNKLPN